MNEMIGVWVEKGNPEDYKELNDLQVMIKGKVIGYPCLFVVKIKSRYDNQVIYEIADRKIIGDEWRWVIRNSLKAIGKNDVKTWYMLPFDRY